MPKEVISASTLPKYISEIHFGVLSPQEIKKVSEIEISNREMYQVTDRKAVPFGVLDRRLGVSDKESTCETCQKSISECHGHFGYIKLELPVFHFGFLKATLTVLQCICKSCASLLLAEEEKIIFLKKLRNPNLDWLQRQSILKSAVTQCKKRVECLKCGAVNGAVKKVGCMKIVHDRFKAKKSSKELEMLRHDLSNAIQDAPEIAQHIGKAQEDLNSLRTLELFQSMSQLDCEVLGLEGRPEHFIWTHIPVPPSCIRPSVAMTLEGGSNEDDLTVKLSDIVYTNSVLKDAMKRANTPSMIIEDWDFLQIQCAMYIHGDVPGLPLTAQSRSAIRGLCQRLKGKQGRFRGNLSGKRVDFSARTVISPDPNLEINQIGVPIHIAKILTFPEVVTVMNIEKMRELIRNGPDVHPGANFLVLRDGTKKFLKYGDRNALAKSLRIGEIVERHLKDDDIVLFNRQPSLHKLSIMAHRVVVKPWRTFRFNECVCQPYNADFDGDEMNLHLPQTEEAKAEAANLLAVEENLVTPRNGQPLIAAIQDFLTASYLITRRDSFFTRGELCQILTGMCDGKLKIDIPPPTLIKPQRLWTGKQLMSLWLNPNQQTLINLETKLRNFVKSPHPPEFCQLEGYLVIRNSEILAGALDKAALGAENKNASILYALMRDYGSHAAAKAMGRLSKLCARYLGNRGFSIGISDVSPSLKLSSKKDKIVSNGYSLCDQTINDYLSGKLQNQPGCTAEQTVEATLTGTLSKIRDDVGQLCLSELSRHNAPLLMTLCGSKGSKINVSQMVACVGQQSVNGTRIPDGFNGRTLPHFEIGSKLPQAKGFVKASFYSGLNPTEFFFHAMGGREGLVDTAIKTAETGYMQRRLMKALEDLSVQYDYSVRSSTGNIVQFLYGDDGLDPAYMETENSPVNFHRNWLDAVNKTAERPKNYIKRHTAKYVNSSQYIDDYIVANQVSCTDAFRDSLKEFLREKISRDNFQVLSNFLKISFEKYQKAKIEPGTACGAIAGQSIGEPGTQMTLKTFHFAGVASMNITLGVPRIKEIINASKNISTPIITAKLVNDSSLAVARIVKGRIERTRLREIAESIEVVYEKDQPHIIIKIDMNAVHSLQLEVTLESIAESIAKKPRAKLTDCVCTLPPNKIAVYSPEDKKENLSFLLSKLARNLGETIVKGLAEVNRAVINTMDVNRYNLLVEGYGLQRVMGTAGIVPQETTCNHVIEVEKVLGIEAARATIALEIQYTMTKHGMTIDNRHVMLLADTMTSKGLVLGITRFGISKMKESVLMLASFEKTTDHLFDAALYGKRDRIDGVSECIIMGVPMPIGTGGFKLVQRIYE